MERGKLLILLTLCLSIQAQEFEESFLKSLPDDVREDVLDRAASNDNNNQTNYRSSQFSSKLGIEEDLLELKSRLENDLNELERRLDREETLNIKKHIDLKLFGEEFFTTFQTSFMPINEPNPDPSYILDVGDVLQIQLIGQENFIELFEIKGDGSINLPEIGRLILAGLTLNEAASIIKSKVDSVFIGTEVFTSIDFIRDVSVLITGNAKNPGIYTLNGNSNILHALTMAGGISKYGSYREINLLRDNKVIETLDIYDLLLTGNYSLKKRLRSGDVIFVSPKKKIVSIDGAVYRPAKYELTDNETLYSAINFSNGLKHTADLENIYLERIIDFSLKSLPIKNISQFTNISPIDGDLIYIREMPYRIASISGAVLKPGTYTIAAGENLDDLIEKAGGFTQNAYPFGTIYESNDAKLINKKANEVLYMEFLDNIIEMSQQNIGKEFDLTPIIALTQEIKNQGPNGRVVVDLLNQEFKDLVKIQNEDTVFVPEITNNIHVFGEVSSEGSVMYSPGKDLEYFIEKSGGFKRLADLESIYILHPNGETERFSKKRNIFESEPDTAPNVYPGSVIFVPKKLDNSVSNRLAAQAYVSILGSLGIALASLSSINNN